MVELAEIHIFPVKALRGGSVDAAGVAPWGLEGDRRWLVTDGAGRFLTQREHARMALIAARLVPGGVVLEAPGLGPLAVVEPHSPLRAVQIWRDTVPAADAGEAAAAYLSQALGRACRLVFLADPSVRKLREEYRQGEECVSFADGFPVLVAGAASLADLNARLASPVPMLRFRPNLVIRGAPAWAEDGWRRIRIGSVVLRIDKPCDRCVVTTIDPATGLRPDPVEPIRTLGRFRRDARGGVMFGQNAVPESLGVVRVGDAVEVLEAGPPNVRLAG